MSLSETCPTCLCPLKVYASFEHASRQPGRFPLDEAEEQWLAPNSSAGKVGSGGCAGTTAFRARLSMWSMSCWAPVDILSGVFSAVQGENLEPISATAVCLRTAVVDLLCVSVKNLLSGNTFLWALLQALRFLIICCCEASV